MKPTLEPVVGVTGITTVPRESDSSVDSLDELGVGSLGIGVSHVVDDSDGERSLVTGSRSGGEGKGRRGGGAVSSGNVVVVGSSCRCVSIARQGTCGTHQVGDL